MENILTREQFKSKLLAYGVCCSQQERYALADELEAILIAHDDLLRKIPIFSPGDRISALHYGEQRHGTVIEVDEIIVKIKWDHMLGSTWVSPFILRKEENK